METEEDLVAGVLRYAMESAVLEQAQAEEEISSECAPISGNEYECTVTFGGEPVRSTISVQDVSGVEVESGGRTVIDSSRISYEVVEQEVVVTDRAVQLAMLDAVENSQDGDSPLSNPRCDEDLPAVQVVADGEQAEGTCYADTEGWRAWPNWSEVFDISGNSVAPIVTKRCATCRSPASEQRCRRTGPGPGPTPRLRMNAAPRSRSAGRAGARRCACRRRS